MSSERESAARRRVRRAQLVSLAIIGIGAGAALHDASTAHGRSDATRTPYVAVLGNGIGPWRIGQAYRSTSNLIRRERHPEHLGGGCIAGPLLATQIDYYPRLRMSWYDDADGDLFLADVATTRQGDRTSRGLVIGRSELATARRLYPNDRVESSPRTQYSLGAA